MAEIPDWMIEKTQVQAQTHADDIDRAAEGNKQQLEDRWIRYLGQWAEQVGTTRIKLVEAAGLPTEYPFLPPPTPR